ncbi:MAG: serine/threonine protein kinase, partial [Thermoanaerobaculia bacterium]
IVGTLDYLSPEQALGNPLDERSDLFSFGIVFYEMLAGRHPFSGTSVTQMVAKMMTKDADPWPEPDLVPESLKQIVAKALKKEPSERYGGAGQMILDLMVVRRELRAKTSRDAITREVLAAAHVPPPGAVAPSTGPFRRKRTSAVPVTSVLRAPRKGPLVLLLVSSLVILAGVATLLATRGCPPSRASTPSSAPAR